jgi:CCR4-NOT transcriptional regulation complex NOT5 subunit
MKKSTLGILTAIIAFAPLTAFAQNTQTNIQNSSNSAAAVGTNNFIHQNTDQSTVQNQVDLGGYGVPKSQTSVQVNANEAAAIGDNNVIDQNASQSTVQNQLDVNQYLPNGYGY